MHTWFHACNGLLPAFPLPCLHAPCILNAPSYHYCVIWLIFLLLPALPFLTSMPYAPYHFLHLHPSLPALCPLHTHLTTCMPCVFTFPTPIALPATCLSSPPNHLCLCPLYRNTISSLPFLDLRVCCGCARSCVYVAALRALLLCGVLCTGCSVAVYKRVFKTDGYAPRDIVSLFYDSAVTFVRMFALKRRQTKQTFLLYIRV